MAVLYATSFEAGTTAYYPQNGWTLSGGFGLTTSRLHLTPGGLGGSYALDLPTPTNTTLISPNFGSTAMWCHAAVAPRTPGTPLTFAWGFLRGGTSTFFVRFNSSGSIELLRGSGGISLATVVATSAGTINRGVPHWIAVKLDATNAGGNCEVWVDGVLIVDYTGDTQGHATLSGWDQWQGAGTNVGSTPDVTIDDFIVTDSTTGRVAEQFCQVLNPTSVISGNLTGSSATGSDRWQNVDEGGTGGPTSQAEYNEAAAINDADLYGLSDPATPTSVLAVVVWTEAARTGAITQIEPAIKSGATTVYATPIVLPTSGYQSDGTIYELDPDTAAAWDAAGLNALQAGARFS